MGNPTKKRWMRRFHVVEMFTLPNLVFRCMHIYIYVSFLILTFEKMFITSGGVGFSGESILISQTKKLKIPPYKSSGQIIATSDDLTPNGGLVREIPLFQGNVGW